MFTLGLFGVGWLAGACVCVCEWYGVCVCVCMRERERERAREMYVCFVVCVYASTRACVRVEWEGGRERERAKQEVRW